MCYVAELLSNKNCSQSKHCYAGIIHQSLAMVLCSSLSPRVVNHLCIQHQEIVDPKHLLLQLVDNWPVLVFSRKEEIYTVNQMWCCR